MPLTWSFSPVLATGSCQWPRVDCQNGLPSEPRTGARTRSRKRGLGTPNTDYVCSRWRGPPDGCRVKRKARAHFPKLSATGGLALELHLRFRCGAGRIASDLGSRISDQEHGTWPEVCVKTGVPTTVTLDLPVVSRPAWPWLLLPVSIVAVAVARAFTSETTVAHIAVSPVAWERYRHRIWIVVATAIVAAGLSIGLFGGVTLALVVVIAAIVAGTCVRRSSWISVSRSDGYYFVVGVHAAYLGAALKLDRREEHVQASNP